MRLAVLALVIACVPLPAAPAAKEKNHRPILYFSTRVGDKMVYEATSDAGKTSEMIMTVTEVTQKSGEFSVTIKSEGGGVVERARVSADSLALTQNTILDMPVTLFKLPAIKGASWVSAPKEKDEAAVSFKSELVGEEEVEVPAGKFKAIRVELTLTVRGQGRTASMWVAEGVGPVKISVPNSKAGQVMKSFTPGK